MRIQHLYPGVVLHFRRIRVLVRNILFHSTYSLVTPTIVLSQQEYMFTQYEYRIHGSSNSVSLTLLHDAQLLGVPRAMRPLHRGSHHVEQQEKRCRETTWLPELPDGSKHLLLALDLNTSNEPRLLRHIRSLAIGINVIDVSYVQQCRINNMEGVQTMWGVGGTNNVGGYKLLVWGPYRVPKRRVLRTVLQHNNQYIFIY